ncbi:Hypothetical protein Bdt_2943 [Bdellovibrio bacteriovorus str. Tiberius]|uniref:Uncharacterized protein n=1 Tax=Bdellovibrio bacteriovorus str. Tiberius TaxID=1069642 RepID=K7YY53_BDEBC|nr:Hypothetical protein Bdt_2943 [Bdellovibrio bacteriovorus str. Tiberius]
MSLHPNCQQKKSNINIKVNGVPVTPFLFFKGVAPCVAL